MLLLYLSWLALAVAQTIPWTTTPFNPPSIPLAVRSPYLSTWLPQDAQGVGLHQTWSWFWTSIITGWAGYIRVDGTAYIYMGTPGEGGVQATQKSITFTSTQSTFVFQAGGVEVTVNFLSPVEPTDLVNQSFPFSYLALTAQANDGNDHAVQLYSDISCEFCTGDLNQIVNWTTTVSNTILTHQAQRVTPAPFAEVGNHIEYGSVYYSTNNAPGVTYQTGWADATARPQFVLNGVLNNTQNATFRAVNASWPVFAFAHDLGTVTASPTSPVVYAIGHVRDPAIQYAVANGQIQERSLYFWSQYSSVYDALAVFVPDYSNAVSRANAFDSKVQSDCSKISSEYGDVVALSVRQAFGATEITISKDASGAWNTTDVMMFMKEISSGGNVNTVDVLYPSWPIFLYTNPVLGKYLLEPVLAYVATGQYDPPYAIHDIGASYPNATGHNDGNDQVMGLEESGNMVIMAYSYYQKTGDTSLLTRYSGLFDQWTKYMVDTALIPNNQNDTDDFAGALVNSTNLAIKGIIGIEAMSRVWSVLKDSSLASNYSSIASNYVTYFQKFAESTPGGHLTLSYGDSTSWGLMYNLYADKLLGLNLFPDSLYETQTAFYQTVEQPFGIPLDTRHSYTKSDWQMLTAAVVTNTTLRDYMITSVRKHAAAGVNSAPMSDWYDDTSGVDQGFANRPVVGAHLGLLVLPSSSSNSSEQNSSKPLSGGAKAGIAIGVILAVALIAGAAYWFFVIRRRTTRSPEVDDWPTADNVTVINPYPSYALPVAGHVEPFNPYGTAGEMTAVSESDRPSIPTWQSGMSAKSQMAMQQQHQINPATSPTLTYGSSSSPPAVPAPVSMVSPTAMSSPRQEVDAMDVVSEPVEEPTIPPPYRYRPNGGAPES